MRTPDETLNLCDRIDVALERAGRGDDFDLRDLIWGVIEDVQNSYDLAMHNAEITRSTRFEIRDAVTDYATNHYGDD